MQLSAILTGLGAAFYPINFLAMLIGLIGGITLGAIPGLGAALGITLLLPLTYSLGPIPAFIMMGGMYAGAQYGGSISAILLKMPGTAAAAATTFDGHPLARKGMAGQAIGMATLGSSLGGLFGVIVMIFLAPQLARLALRFGPPEYFALAMFGLSIVGALTAKSVVKGIISVALGLFFATVGLDPISGVPRYIFGIYGLMDGIHFVPLMIGLFAMAEVISRAAEGHQAEHKQAEVITNLIPKLEDIKACGITIMRSALIGTGIGILPGAGGTIASFLAYSDALRNSKEPEKFGQGCLEGVAAPESANNAACGGAMVPLLSLGIPGSSVTAIMLGAFILHGLHPGPMLFTQQQHFVNAIFGGLVLTNIAMLPVGLLGARIFSKVMDVPYYILGPIISIFAVVGSYSIRNSYFDVWVMLIFGVLGFIMNSLSIPTSPMVLGVVLGTMAETSLRRGMLVVGGNAIAFLTRPVVAVLLLLTVFSFVSPFFRTKKVLRKQINAEGVEES